MTSRARPPDRDSGTPLWAQVLNDVKRRLANGEFATGVPSERELIAEYGVSRHTVRYAIGQLQTAGVIERGRGKGSFVRQPTIEQPTGMLYSLFRSVEEQGFVQRSTVLALCQLTNPSVAARLALRAQAKLVYLHRVRFADDIPLAVDELWLPHDLVAPVLHADFAHTSLYNELEVRCGIRPGAGSERITPVLPTADENERLQSPPGQSAFLIERTTEFNGRPLEWRRTVVRGDQFAFVTTWDRGGGANTALTTTRSGRGGAP